MKHIVETPYGVVRWEGDLREDTTVTIDSANSQRFSRLLAMTNGEIVQYLSDYL